MWSQLGWKRFLLIPRLAILDSRVWRGIPNFAAAPDGPDTRPLLARKASSMRLRS